MLVCVGQHPSPCGVRGLNTADLVHPQQIFSIFYFKRRILVDSDVLNVPVTRTRAWHTFTFISISLRVTSASMLE